MDKKKILTSFEEFALKNESHYRRKCYKCRVDMILNPGFNFMVILSAGFFTLLPTFVSIIIIHSKFKAANTADTKDDHLQEYSNAFFPLILLVSLFLIGSVYQLIDNVKTMLRSSVYVWHRDNFGRFVQQVIFYSCILVSLCRLRYYVLMKEDNKWKPDSPDDHRMDFKDAFYPVYVMIILFLAKALCCKGADNDIKVFMAFTVLAIIYLGSFLFDNNPANDPIWPLAVPISFIIISVAYLDLRNYKSSDFSSRIFYNLDVPLKAVWVYGHIISSIIYSFCLLYWLYRVDYNAENKRGFEEDANLLHLSLSSYIFYAIFLLERAGNYTMDHFQSQFEFEMMK